MADPSSSASGVTARGARRAVAGPASRVVVASDAFKGSLTSVEVGDAVRVGLVAGDRIRPLDADVLGGGLNVFLADPDWDLRELATGHWAMFSAPDYVAETLHEIAS